MTEALQFANDRPTSLNDDLYQWASDAEQLIRKQDAEIASMRSLLMRWLNDAMSIEDVKLLEQQTLETLK